jgi:hypothetical protein
VTKRQTKDLSYIVEPLRAFAVPIDTLIEDPSNSNTHDERSIRAIMGSMARYKQRTPLVVNQDGSVVEKGNGTLEAARRLGWTHIAAIFVDDDGVTHAGYSIADNRTSQLSQVDDAALARLIEQVKELDPEEPVTDMWTEVEWDELMAGLRKEYGYDDDGEDLDEVDFSDYEVDLADDVEMVTCPKCGHEFPS